MATRSVFSLDDKVGMLYYITDSQGIGGRTKTEPEDFVVVENSVIQPEDRGQHLALIIWKKGITTRAVVNHLANKLHIPARSIGVAGMKDKWAVAIQKVSIPFVQFDERILEIDGGLRVLGKVRTNRKIRIGHLRGNYFKIRVRGARNLESVHRTLVQMESRGCPNYYGYQRFGKRVKNHLLGRMLLRREYEAVFKEMGVRLERPGIRDLLRLDLGLLRFFINSYQSYLFNLMLSRRVETGLPLVEKADGDFVKGGVPAFPTVGYKSKIPSGEPGEIVRSVLEAENVKPEDFKHEIRKFREKGGLRKVHLTYDGLRFEIKGGDVLFNFWLEKGCYATVFLREVCKWTTLSF